MVFVVLDTNRATLTVKRPSKYNLVPKRAMPGETLPSPPDGEMTETNPEDGASKGG